MDGVNLYAYPFTEDPDCARSIQPAALVSRQGGGPLQRLPRS